MIDPTGAGQLTGMPTSSELNLTLLVYEAHRLTRERLLEALEARCAELLEFEGKARTERNFLGGCLTDLRVGQDPGLVAAVIRTRLTRSKD